MTVSIVCGRKTKTEGKTVCFRTKKYNVRHVDGGVAGSDEDFNRLFGLFVSNTEKEADETELERSED